MYQQSVYYLQQTVVSVPPVCGSREDTGPRAK